MTDKYSRKYFSQRNSPYIFISLRKSTVIVETIEALIIINFLTTFINEKALKASFFRYLYNKIVCPFYMLTYFLLDLYNNMQPPNKDFKNKGSGTSICFSSSYSASLVLCNLNCTRFYLLILFCWRKCCFLLTSRAALFAQFRTNKWFYK